MNEGTFEGLNESMRGVLLLFIVFLSMRVW